MCPYDEELSVLNHDGSTNVIFAMSAYCVSKFAFNAECWPLQVLSKATPQPGWSQLMLRMMPKLKAFLTEELVKINVPTTPCS